MPPATRQNPRRRRWRRWLLPVAAILVALAWSWGWHEGAAALDARIAALLARSNTGGGQLACPGRRLGGFPVGFDLACDSVAFASAGQGIAVDAGALGLAVRLWHPTSLAARLDGPLTATGATVLSGDWDDLAATLRFGLDGPTRLSLRSSRLVLRRQDGRAASFAALDLAVERAPGEAGARPLDLSLSGRGIALDPDGAGALPPLSLTADLRLDDLSADFNRRFDLVRYLRENGISGLLRNVDLAASGTRLSASGPFKLARDGLVSARLDIAASDLGGLREFVVRVAGGDPDVLERFGQAFALLSAAGFGAGSRLTLVIDEGQVRAGILPLGRIPPLF